MSTRTIANRDLLATSWTWAGDAAPARGDETSPCDIRTRIETAATTGWQGIGLVHADLVKARDTIGLGELKKIIDDNGIRHVELEFISNWWSNGESRAASDAVRRDLFEAAPELGVTTIKVGAELQAFGAGPSVDYDLFATEFDALATDAGRRGLRVAIEPMPMSNLTTIIAGARMVRQIGNASGGLVVDIWHVRRGGTSFAEMAGALPLEHVFVVELDDADAEPIGSLWDDTINQRRLPGDGVLGTAEFIAAMHELGWRDHWGVEIISEIHRHAPLEEILRLTRQKTLAAIDNAERLPEKEK